MPRIVLVTGAAAGIGLATARAFAEHGDTVVLADIDGVAATARAAELGAAHAALALDIADGAAVASAVTSVAGRFGRIDVLVNNAGVVDPRAHAALDVPLSEVERLIAVNLSGSHAVACAAAAAMRTRGGGAIVNVASGAALAALPGRAAYGMTKAALLGLTRALAAEWARDRIAVNAVLPGYVATEIIATLQREGRFDAAAVARAIPLGRLAAPREIAAVIRHVAGARGLSGASIVADGGVDAFGGSGAASSAPAPRPSEEGVVLLAGAIPDIVSERLAVAGRTALRLDPALDLADPDAVARAVAAVRAPVAALVAGGALPTPLTAPLVLARAVAPAMRAHGGGAIAYLLPATTAGAAEAAAVAGTAFLARAIACESAPLGIRANAVVADDAGVAAEAAAFLVSAAASYVTGATWTQPPTDRV